MYEAERHGNIAEGYEHEAKGHAHEAERHLHEAQGHAYEAEGDVHEAKGHAYEGYHNSRLRAYDVINCSAFRQARMQKLISAYVDSKTYVV